MPNLQLANNLRHLRKSSKMTQRELGDKLSISRQAYSNYETSKRTPDLDSLLRLSEFFNIDLSTLVLVDLKKSKDLNASMSPAFSEGKIPYILSADKKNGNKLYITEEEQQLITKFRSLSSENKRIVTGFINGNSAIKD